MIFEISAKTVLDMADAIARLQRRLATVEAQMKMILILQGLSLSLMIAVAGWLIANE